MRTRFIKPSICSNDDLAELGPYSYILFTGLWMLADREGRFEYRPKRIKALVMPLWDEVTVSTVENLVENLCKKGMLRLSVVKNSHDVRYGYILNWKKHQHVDPREAQSAIPPLDDVSPAPAPDAEHSVIPLSTRSVDAAKTVGFSYLDSCIKSGGGSVVESIPAPVQNSVSPPPPSTPKRKAPAREQRSPAPASQPVARPLPVRKASAGERPVARGGPQDQDQAVKVLRASLDELARLIRMPPPDDALIRQVLDAAGGASADNIHETLAALYKRGKFDNMHSWGFVPHLMRNCFRAAS